MYEAETFPRGIKTYYLAYRVPLHGLTQFDLSFAQEVVNSCVFSKAPKVGRKVNSVTYLKIDILQGKKPKGVPFPLEDRH